MSEWLQFAQRHWRVAHLKLLEDSGWPTLCGSCKGWAEFTRPQLKLNFLDLAFRDYSQYFRWGLRL